MSLRQQVLRKIPSVDEVLSRPEVIELLRIHSRSAVVEAIRRALDRVRRDLLSREEITGLEDEFLALERLYTLLQKELDLLVQPRLRHVINATGVVIHTNLGRSPLHLSALQHILDVASAYSNLEYDIELGERGSRYVHVEETLCRLTGAESAMVVNNNAGAVLLALNSIAEGKEVIVSRGELVEIGGAFRIPDVMKRSGALLREVGTTNRTHLRDYQNVIGPQAALLLKVHTSNFRVLGFTSEVSLQDLIQLGRQENLPVMNDLGSGSLVDLSLLGLEKEPTVQEAIRTGVDVVTFSGDKLLGGPQAGILLGKKSVLDLIKKNPLTRALRIDKLTLAALESTLLLYLDEKRALQEVPTLRLLGLDKSRLKAKGRRLLKKMGGKTERRCRIILREDISQVGGGALPLQELPTTVVAIKPENHSVNTLEERLRKGDPPIIARISKDELILDMRTVFDDQIPVLANALEKALSSQTDPG